MKGSAMSVEVSVKAVFTIRCEGYNRHCDNSIKVDGFVGIADGVDIDSVPSNHDVIESSDYELPPGWSENPWAYCPKCTREFHSS